MQHTDELDLAEVAPGGDERTGEVVQDQMRGFLIRR
jgi:hypothetical protein